MPFGVRKQALKLYKKFFAKGLLPKYTMKDFNEVFQIYPFMLEYPIGVGKTLEEEYVKFMVTALL